MRKLIKEILKFIYYIFPRFLRYEYIDSLHFYRNTLVRVFSKNDSDALESDSDALESDDDVVKVIEVGLVDDIDSLDVECEVLYYKTGNYSEISSPKLYIDNLECRRSSLKSSLPDIKVIRLTGVCVLGGTDAVIYGDKMYHHELKFLTPKHDMKRPDIFIKNTSVEAFDYEVITNSRRIVNGVSISLLKEHTSNYYHCMTEVIPKLIKIKNSFIAGDENVNILIDECMPEQCVRVIEIILSATSDFSFSLIKIEKAELITCDELIYCTPLWLSLDNTTHLPNPKKEFFLSFDGLLDVKHEVSRSVTTSVSPDIVNSRIYLQRSNNKLRKITNIIEVERVLYKFGFDFVDTGSLSFEEQYRLFSQADFIFGASGASFTNVLFMKPGSQAIMLSPSAQCTNYFIFQPLADASNIELSHLLTVPSLESSSLHEDASVNINELETYLNTKFSILGLDAAACKCVNA